jgi:hypothetical protein
MTLAEWEHLHPEEVKVYREYMRLRDELLPPRRSRKEDRETQSGQLSLLEG